MASLNDNYLKLKAGYLFPEIGRRVKAFNDANPAAAARLIRCGIGDVTEPLPAAVVAALHKAVDEMAVRSTFKGYGPEQGYEWLRAAIAQNDFRARGLEVADDEIFVSDGSKCDCGAILDIMGSSNRMAITDPVYPVYVDTNVMAGHTGEADASGGLEAFLKGAEGIEHLLAVGILDEGDLKADLAEGIGELARVGNGIREFAEMGVFGIGNEKRFFGGEYRSQARQIPSKKKFEEFMSGIGHF